MEGDVAGGELATMGTLKPALKTLHAMSHRVCLGPIFLGFPGTALVFHWKRTKHETILQRLSGISNCNCGLGAWRGEVKNKTKLRTNEGANIKRVTYLQRACWTNT